MDYPKSDAGARLQNGKFTDGDPVNNIPPSKDSAVYQNMVFDELINAITEGGATPDATKSDQLAGIIRQLKSGGRILGEPFWHLGETPPVKALQFSGQLLDRSEYSELWEALNDQDRNIIFISDTEWLNGRFGCWSTGNGSTTFRVPMTQADFIRAFDNSRAINQQQLLGQWESDELRSHNHATTSDSRPVLSRQGSDAAVDYHSSRAHSSDANYNGSQVTGHTGGSETKPRSVAWMQSFWFQ